MGTNFPRIVQDYCERIFDQFEAKRIETFDSITTKKDMEAFVLKCRNTVRELYALPKEKTDLNTRVTGEIKCKGYTIEKIIYESRPGFLVTASLYIPDGQGPFPCVLGTCGHSNEGKAAEFYQSFSAGLALKGFLVLIYDPIGQGERWQYLDYKDIIPGCVAEHITAGRQQYMLGEFFGTWRAWDGIRGLDCLLERPEADPLHVGLTGNSGGGTMTSILTSLDDRFTMAAPSCYITTYRYNLINELPGDTEQILPGMVAAGYEEYDHITAAAPRPTLICTKEDDFFDQRGSQEAYQYLKKVYSLLEKPDDIEIVTGKGGHGFSQDLREAMYAFFCKHTGIDDDGKEAELTLHSIEDLNATESGQVVKEGSRRVVDFTREKLDKAKTERSGFTPEKLKELLSLEDIPSDPPPYRVIRRRIGKSRIAVETEESIFTVFKYLPIEDADFRIPPLTKVTLYISHIDDEEDFENEPFLKEYTEKEDPVFVVSLRGTGESVYNTCGDSRDYLSLYNSDYIYSAYCHMYNLTMAGRRVFDLLRVIQLLESYGYESFELVGRGIGALAALYSAPFVSNLEKLRIKNCISAFEDMVGSDLHLWPLSVLVPDMLLYFDLPDIAEYLKSEKNIDVEITDPWDANLKPV
jgi:dienelactone hydrolase